MTYWILHYLRLYWHPHAGFAFIMGLIAGAVATVYVLVLLLGPDLHAGRFVVPVAVILLMGVGLQYVAVRRLGRSPWAFSLGYVLPFLFWTLLSLGMTSATVVWICATAMVLLSSALAGYVWARPRGSGGMASDGYEADDGADGSEDGGMK